MERILEFLALFCFLVAIVLLAKGQASLEDTVLTHGEIVIIMNRDYQRMQIEIETLIKRNQDLTIRLKNYEAINDTFKRIVQEKFPHFIEKGGK